MNLFYKIITFRPSFPARIIFGLLGFVITLGVCSFVGIADLRAGALGERDQQFNARTVEAGARDYVQYCSRCHGVEGKGVEDVGPALSTVHFLGKVEAKENSDTKVIELNQTTPSERMKELGWTGSVLNYIKGVTAAGMPVKTSNVWGENHPTFAQAYGGPLREDQISNISQFVANWALDPYTGTDVVVAPAPGAGGAAKATAVPLTADQEAGKLVFAASGCVGCHAIKGYKEAAGQVGPNLTKIWSDSEAIVKSDDYLKNVKGQPPAKTAEEYVIQSIHYPNAYIYPKCPSGPCAAGIMVQTYKAQFDAKPDDFKKLLSYLSTLK